MIPRFKPWLGIGELLRIFCRNKGAVGRFESEFARTFEAADAVAFPYGRSALWAFLNTVGVKDAEVVMPAYTCSVVAHAISLSGNRPRFVDIRLSDYNMDLDLLPAAINERTRAVVATHLFGYPLDLGRLEAIVREAEAKYGQKIWLIQDCAHSFGARWNGRLVGSSGDVALYGLNVSKTMTSVFGGMLTFGDQALAKRVRIWRDAHFVRSSWLKSVLRRLYLLAVYVAFSEVGYSVTWWLQARTPFLNRLTKSYHLEDRIVFPPDALEQMSDFEAAVGRVQLRKYPQIVARRRAVAVYLDGAIERKRGWVFPPVVEGATYSHYVVMVPDRRTCVRDAAERGVELGELIQYSVAEMESYRGSENACPNAALASKCTINIPMHKEISRIW